MFCHERCASVGHLHFKNSTEQKKKRQESTQRLILKSLLKPNALILEKSGGKSPHVVYAAEFIFEITRKLRTCGIYVFKMIYFLLSQASVHLLCLLCLLSIDRLLFGTGHYNNFEINLMNQKNHTVIKLLQKSFSRHSHFFSCDSYKWQKLGKRQEWATDVFLNTCSVKTT